MFLAFATVGKAEVKMNFAIHVKAWRARSYYSVVSRGERIVDVLQEWRRGSNLGLRLDGEGLLTPTNNSFMELRVY